MSDDRFLSRWSRRKAQAKGPAAEPPPAVAPVTPAASAPPAPEVPAPLPLPPVESLTVDSDFAPFMQPGVDASLRRTALRTLLGDPRFNIMDGLDVYIDDYSKPDPLPEGWLEKLNMATRLGDYQPPKEPADDPREARETPRLAQNPEAQQAVDAGKSPDVSDTSDAGSPPSELKQSAPPGAG
jgi:Protein of unknown function (DUF3306)